MKRVRINNEIRARELRVIGDQGDNFGVLELNAALELAKEKELDLIEISPTAKPPVAKIMDFGKFQYQEKKKEKEAKKKVHETETKAIQIGIGTSEHDLELKVKKISKFFKEGHRVKIGLILKGRAKYMGRDFANERLERLLKMIEEKYKIADGPKKGPRGIMVIIEHVKDK